MKQTTSSSDQPNVLLLVGAGIVAILCCAGPFIIAALAGSAVPLLIGAHQTLVAVLGAAIVVVLVATVISRARGRSLPVLARDALHLAFTPPSLQRSTLLIVLIGIPLTAFYLVALPAERFGALAWGALQFLTTGDALAAVLLGVGVPLTIALNLAARRTQATQTTLTLGGVIAALLPSSLCCTTLIPSVLAALGASAPAIMHTSGRYQAFFAQYADAFIGFAVAAVLFSLWLAASNLVAGCITCVLPAKESQ